MNYFLVKKSFTVTLSDQLIEIPEGSLVTLQTEGTYAIRHHKLTKEISLSRTFVVENSQWIKQVDSLEWEKVNNIDLLIRLMKDKRIDPSSAIEAIENVWPKLTNSTAKLPVVDDNYWLRNATFTQI
jgi:hypothetical protein